MRGSKAFPVLLLLAVATVSPARASDVTAGKPTATSETAWQWPSSAASAEVRRSIEEAGYNPDELSNVRRTLEFLAARDRSLHRELWYTPDYHARARGFEGLEAFYGSNGYSLASVPDRTDNADFIIAKGNRVYVSWFILGHHGGKVFGFPATGKAVKVRESALLVFREGKIAEALFLGDDFALYTQAGGKVEFPKDH